MKHKSDKAILQFHKSIVDGLKERDINKCVDAEIESLKRSQTYYKS
jgi:hypothetical protein